MILFKKHSTTLKSVLVNKMECCKTNGKINSFYRIRSTTRALERYDHSMPVIPLTDITPAMLRGCERYWIDSGLSTTTVNIYMKTLKSVLSSALKSGELSPANFPFGKGRYEIPPSASRNIALSKEDVRKIVLYKGSRSREHYRDLWLFSYLCNGINFRDMLFLKWKDMKNGEIVFVRSKTRYSTSCPKLIRASVTPEMMAIMLRNNDGCPGTSETFIFKYAQGGETPQQVSNLVRKVTSMCNRAMSCLADEVGLPHFTTYSARHTFATILQREGVNISYISECLGHSSLKITETYLAGFDSVERQKYSKLLTDFL